MIFSAAYLILVTGADIGDPVQPEAALPMIPASRLSFLMGGGTVGFWLIVAAVGPYVAPHAPGQVVDLDVFGRISRALPLGSDYLGRDVLSRVLIAARFTVSIALMATLLAAVCGIFWGMIAAGSDWLDAILGKLFDTLNAVPSLMFALVVVASLGASTAVLTGTLAVVYSPGAFARRGPLRAMSRRWIS
jgi:peptide/nickel transport system permease protein